MLSALENNDAPSSALQSTLPNRAEMPQPPPAPTEPQPVLPPAPSSVAEVGVSRNLLEDLALKTIYAANPPSVLDLSQMMRIPYWVGDELFRHLRAEQLVEVTGMRGNAPMLALSSRGRARALELLAANQYTGPAPVSLADYTRQVRQQSALNPDIHAVDINRAYAHLVLGETTLAS